VRHGARLEIAADVAELLGAGDLEMLRRSAATGYRCVACGSAGQLAAGPAAVVVRLTVAPGAGPDGPQVAHVRLAHPSCAESHVAAEAGAIPEPTVMTMTGTAAVLRHRGGRRALLIAEPSWHLSVISGSDRVDPVLAGLLGQGLHLLASARESPPDSPGWLVSLPSRAEAVIRDASGGLFYTGRLDQPRPWHRLASSRGQVELLTGVVGFSGSGPGDRGEGLLTALADTAGLGRLVGGTIAVG
jgi:hypothetical protein